MCNFGQNILQTMSVSASAFDFKVTLAKQFLLSGLNYAKLKHTKIAVPLHILFGSTLYDALNIVDNGSIQKFVNEDETDLFVHRVTDAEKTFTVLTKSNLCSCQESKEESMKDSLADSACEHILAVLLGEKLNKITCVCYSNEKYCRDISNFKFNQLLC